MAYVNQTCGIVLCQVGLWRKNSCWKVVVLYFAGAARFLLTITEFSNIRGDISTNPNTKYLKVYDSDCFYSCLIST